MRTDSGLRARGARRIAVHYKKFSELDPQDGDGASAIERVTKALGRK
jgi:hypothetical protein